jgi:NAD(P)-dependent dehydrogenase (short-subunit alcohol dehydrogenase family)
MSSTLTGRRALITGAGRGIGREVALALADAGVADLVLVARTREALDGVADDVAGRTRPHVIPCDVGDPDQVARAAAEAGEVDILVNNAAIVGPAGPTPTVDLAEWRRTQEINVLGALAFIQALVPGMVQRGWGRVLNVSTGGALAPGMPEANAYSVSKAALDMLTLNLADELKGTGVTVNLVRPGTTDTEMQVDIRTRPVEVVGERLNRMFTDFHDSGRLHSPELPARLIVTLLASDTTGEAVNIYDERGQELLDAS